jgi:hypothetical protein
MRTLILLVFSLILFTCGTNDSAVEAMADASEEVDVAATAAKAEATNHLKNTIEAAQSVGGDITALPTAAAANNINGWITKLIDVDGADGVVNGLAMLKKELMQESIDGDSVSTILADLANETRTMSDRAPALNTLANVLEAGSKKLAGK